MNSFIFNMEPFKLLKSKEELSPERSKSKGELRSRAEGTDELFHERSKSQDPLAPASLKSIDELSLDRSKSRDQLAPARLKLGKNIQTTKMDLVRFFNFSSA